MIHYLKIQKQYASQQLAGFKPWEIRYNDRDFKVGDFIQFIILDDKNEPSGFGYRKQITYILEGGVFGIKKGWCVLTIK